MSSNKKTLIDGDFQVGSDHFKVDTVNNYVGFNNATPQNTIDVQVGARTGTHSTGKPLYVTGVTSTSGAEFVSDDGTAGIGIGSSNIFATETNQNITIAPDGTGAVGIKTSTPNPSGETFDLWVQGDTKITGNVTVGTIIGDGSGLTNIISSQWDSSSEDIYFLNNSGSGSGRVAIGTSTPVSLLTLEGTSGGAPPTTGQEGTSNALVRVRDDNNVTLDIGTSSGTSWLQSSDATAMGTNYAISINPNGGNVGVGTISPNVPLEVNKSAGGEILRLTTSTGTLYAGADADPPWFGTSSDDHLRLMTNGTEKVRIESGGNVGIGITSPGFTLDVGGDINFTGDLYENGSLFVNTPWTIETSPDALNYTAGNVGIGGANPSSTLEVTGNTHISSNLSVGGTLTLNTITAAALHSLQAVTDVGNVTSNTVQFTNATTGFVTTANIEVGTANLFVDTTTGNVGIGKTDPGSALDVVGDVEISGETVLGTATYRKRRDWNRNALAYVYLGNVKTNTTTGIRLDVSLNNSNSGYQMYQFQITLQGNDTSHAGGKLVYSVQGTQNSSVLKAVDIGYVYVGGGGQFEYQLWLKDPTTDLTGNMDAYLNCQGYYNFDTGVSDVAQGGAAPTNFQDGIVGVLVDTSGKVGIGTTNATSKLYIQDDNANTKLTIRGGGSTVNDSNVNIELLETASDFYGATIQYCGTLSSQGLRFGHHVNSATPRFDMAIDRGSGNVGIGTTSPATKLHVEHYGSAIGDFEGIRIANHATNLHASSRPAYEFVVSDIDAGTGLGNGKFAIGYRDTTSASRTDRLVIDNSGKVGIGTTDPARTLDVEGTFVVDPGNGRPIGTDARTDASPNDNTNSGTTDHIATFFMSLSRTTTQTSRPIYFGSGDDTDTTLVIGTTGGLGGPGFTNTNLKLTGASYLYVKRVYANGSQLSDDRLKINEEPIKNATKTILKLKPLVYDKYEKLGELTSNVFEVESGLMVQDVWYDTPELRHIVDVPDDAKPTETKEEDPEYTSWGSKPAYLTYTQLLPYIIKSIQEIHNEKGKLKLDYYGSGIDIDTHRGMIICNHPTVHLCNNERDPTCVGVLSDIDTNEVLLKTRGVGNVWIINTNGNLNAGDYITTSIVSGYGQKQNSEFLANYTVAKILEPCNFTETSKPVKRAIKSLEDVTYYVIHKKILINEELYNRLPENERHIETFTSVEGTITDYYKLLRTESKHFREGAETITRQELVNVLDEHGQLQWEETDETEKAYKIRYLDANGVITDEANAVHKAAFVGCTYHCG
jgi:thiamine phosphate synthase YjbQ (UPF0047 family)